MLNYIDLLNLFLYKMTPLPILSSKYNLIFSILVQYTTTAMVSLHDIYQSFPIRILLREKQNPSAKETNAKSKLIKYFTLREKKTR